MITHMHDTASSLQAQSMACSRLRSLKSLLQRSGRDTQSFANAPALLHPLSWCACPVPQPETFSCSPGSATFCELFPHSNFMSILKPVLCAIAQPSVAASMQGGARGLDSDERAGNASASSHRAFQGNRGRKKLLGLLVLAG